MPFRLAKRSRNSTLRKPALSQNGTFTPSGCLPPDASLPGVALGQREPSKPPSSGRNPPARRRNGRQPQLRGRPAGNVGPPGAQGRWFGACVAPHQPRPCLGRGRPPRVQRHPATGLTKAVSTATWAPCHSGSPLARTSMRRESASGTSITTAGDVSVGSDPIHANHCCKLTGLRSETERACQCFHTRPRGQGVLERGARFL